MSKKANLIIYSLFLIQIVLTFILSIFGNKISEEINISPSFLIIGTIALILISLLITIQVSQLEKVQQTTPPLNPFGQIIVKIGTIFFGRIVTILPISLIIGVVIAWAFISIMPSGVSLGVIYSRPTEIPYIHRGTSVGPNLYEIATLFAFVFILYMLSIFKSDFSLNLSCAIGLANGAAGAISLLRPQENHAILTIIMWNIVNFIILVLVRQQSFKSFVRRTIDSMIQER